MYKRRYIFVDINVTLGRDIYCSYSPRYLDEGFWLLGVFESSLSPSAWVCLSSAHRFSCYKVEMFGYTLAWGLSPSLQIWNESSGILRYDIDSANSAAEYPIN